MSRLNPESARKRARLARPLSSFTPEQRRLLLALIEAGASSPVPASDLRHGPATTRSRARR
jgi:hypothetical protein